MDLGTLSSQITPVVIVDETGQTAISQPVASIDSNFTGLRTVPTAGTPVPGPNVYSATGFMLKGHPDNTDTVWFFPAGRTKADGFPLNANNLALANVNNLNLLSFDADINNQKWCWMRF